tara:strand:- start:142 stop:492 length:351 start_codon:yes stop_codon:yes gene_type:complete
MGWKDRLLKKSADVVGRALPKSKWRKDKTGTITGVKPGSGKVPEHIGAGGTDLKKRADIVKTHFSLKRSRKIDKAAEDVKRGKEKLKKLVDTGQAEELKGYKDKPTGVYIKKGFKD